MIEALIASIGYAGGIITDKTILSKYKVPVGVLNPVVFIFLAIITAVFLPIYGRFNFHDWLDLKVIILFGVMIVTAVIWNILSARGLQKENLHEFELIMLLTPLATIVMAALFLPSERHIGPLVAGIIASLAFLFSRIKKHHIIFTKVAKWTILGMLLASFESILIKLLLPYFSPVTLYFVRVLIVAIIFMLMYRPKILEMKKEAFALMIISAIFGVMQMVLRYYGFQNLGVVETTMVLLLGPILVYTFSYLFFGEKKFFLKDAFTAGIIVVCILYVTFIKY